MAYRHGVYTSEVPTGIRPPARVNSAMPVVFGTAPIHLSDDPYAVTNKPQLCFTNAEAVRALGMSTRPEIWNSYTLPQVIFSQFQLFAVSPIVFVNVLDPKIHNVQVTGETITLNGTLAVLKVEGVLLDTISVSNRESLQYTSEVNYSVSFNRDGHVVINALDGIAENSELVISYTRLAPEQVDIFDIIGGYNSRTGKNEGLEILNDIFPHFRLVPGQLLAPGFSDNPIVAAVMETRAGNINGTFACIALCDMPTMIENSQGELVHHRFTDIPNWKNQNNYVFTRQINLYPKLGLGGLHFYYSTQMAGLIGLTDSQNSNTPYVSPSNQNLNMNALVYADGEEIVLNTEQANFLNGQGIVTAINFVNGWTAWGNRTGAFPGNNDPKDAFIPIRRMFDWIANTLVLTYWQDVSSPITRRFIDRIVDSVNIWLNGLASREFILGGRIEFIGEYNPMTDLMDGIVRFKISITPPGPAREIEFIKEYDPEYLNTLFG